MKRHQCFCGAWFTRADNLKRHIRKCHEEKLEKLPAAPLDTSEPGDESALGSFNDYPNMFSEQDGVGSQQQQSDAAKSIEDQQQLQHFLSANPQILQQHDGQNLIANSENLNPDQNPQTHDANTNSMLSNTEEIKSSLMKWSCFCGEHFEDHRQLVEHTRIHEVTS